MDLMVICAEAGLSLDATLKRVSDEMAVAAPEISDELALTALELGFLPDRRKALENLASRIDLPGVRGLVTTLLQAEKYGTPLANSLRVLSAEFREERMMKAEGKSRPPAGAAHGSDDHLHPASPVRRSDRPRHPEGDRRLQRRHVARSARCRGTQPFLVAVIACAYACHRPVADLLREADR